MCLENVNHYFFAIFTVRFITEMYINFFLSGIRIVQAVLFLELSLCVTVIQSMRAVYYNVCEAVTKSRTLNFAIECVH